jgi:hypothetical protein
MSFNLEKSVELLQRTPAALNTLFHSMEHDWAHVNEGLDTWSAFDIVGHLIHGEMTDWIPRCKIILDDSIVDKTFIPFDRFAQEKASKGKSIEQLLEEFTRLRDRNVQLLQSWNLQEKELKKTGIHPDLGIVSLQQLIATWAVHDMSHIHQFSRVIVKHYKDEVGPWKQYIRILKD